MERRSLSRFDARVITNPNRASNVIVDDSERWIMESRYTRRSGTDRIRNRGLRISHRRLSELFDHFDNSIGRRYRPQSQPCTNLQWLKL